MNKFKWAIVLFSILPSLSWAQASDSAQQKNMDDKCFVMGKVVKQEADLTKEGANINGLYSKLFNFNILARLGEAEVSSETRERVSKVQTAYDGLKQDLFTGEAKAKALSTAFYEIHNINLNIVQQADKNFPDCGFTKESAAVNMRKAKPSSSKSSSGVK